MNEDGHVSNPRRGLLAAGLAAAVVGSLGVFSTMNAAAGETPAAPAVVEDPLGPVAPGLLTPPPLLPWGEKPSPVKVGKPGASSEELAASGADIAPNTANEAPQPQAGYYVKGFNAGKRKFRGTRSQNNAAVPPAPPVQADQAPPPKGRNIKFQYAGAYQFGETDGSYANLVIAKPSLDTGEYHTLAEIAVESADQKQTVEVGWTVDRSLNKGDTDPHFFVYHWVDDETSCYNACGWVQYSKNVQPGDIVATGSKRFGIVRSSSAWWINYDSEWIGYFPDTLWDGRYKKAGLVQWFGEVASKSADPCSDMGTGKDAGDDGAARFGTIAMVNGPDVAYTLDVSGKDENGKAIPGTYSAKGLSSTTLRYGGPGATCGDG
jgi:hypothetical protein